MDYFIKYINELQLKHAKCTVNMFIERGRHNLCTFDIDIWF